MRLLKSFQTLKHFCYSNAFSYGKYPPRNTFGCLRSFQIFFHISARCKAHTTKGWKAIAVSGNKLKPEVDIESNRNTPVSCEEGKDAVLHSHLIQEFQKCSSVSSQIETFCSLISLSAEEIERRTLFCQSLEEVLKIYFKNFKLHQFGSSVNGLGFKGCDMDLSLQTLFKEEEYVTLKDVPTLDSVIEGSTSQDTLSRLTPMFMLRFVRRILRQHVTDVKEPILFIKARCPIIRFYNEKYDVFCDFSCETGSSLQNTRLMMLACHLDEKFKVLAKVIRYWGKYGGFVGDIDMFNSYSFSLFVLFFMQTRNPPVLPSVKEMLEKSNYLKEGEVGDFMLMMEDLKKFKKSCNSTSIDQLLKDFFFYYLKFDFERVILPYTSSTLHKNEFVHEDPEKYFGFGTLSIQDPFRHNFNATAVASYKSCLKFISHLIQTCETYQDETKLIPGNEMWGLCSIFKPPVNENKLSKEWQKIRKHHLKLPARSDAVVKLKSILEQGLLFQCKEYRTFNSSDETQIGFKLHCKSYHNTWQGRDSVHQMLSQPPHQDILKLENLISQEILKNRTELKRELLAEIICEGREILSNNQKSLLLDLEFKGARYPYVLALFLKEYIPNIYNKL